MYEKLLIPLDGSRAAESVLSTRAGKSALRVKAAHSQRSLSDLVNEAVRLALREDQEDLADIKARKREPKMTYDQLLKDLKAHGKI